MTDFDDDYDDDEDHDYDDQLTMMTTGCKRRL